MPTNTRFLGFNIIVKAAAAAANATFGQQTGLRQTRPQTTK